MKRLHQQGFGTIEVLLILVIVAILGFTGWFVWHSKQATDKTLSDTNKSAQSTTPKTTTKTLPTTPSQARLTLDNNHVSLTTPTAWSSTTPGGTCMLTVDSKATCLDKLEVSPTDASKAKVGDAFGVSVAVAKYENATSLTDWFWNQYAGELQTSSDTVATTPINKYDTFTRTQSSNSYVDKYYALRKDTLVVLVYARVSATHYTPAGVVDEHNDYTNYMPQITQLVNSIAIQ